jgi:hypothetical protein
MTFQKLDQDEQNDDFETGEMVDETVVEVADVGDVDGVAAVDVDELVVGVVVVVVVVVVWGAVMQVVKKLLLNYVFGKHIHLQDSHSH